MKPDEGVWYSVGGLFKGPIRMLDKTSGKNGADILNVNHQVCKSCKTIMKYLKYSNVSHSAL